MKRRILSNVNIIIFIVIIFFVWLFFFDRHSFISLRQVNAQIEELERERDFYRSRIVEDSLVIEGLNDSSYVARYARENFLMIAPGDELYLID